MLSSEEDELRGLFDEELLDSVSVRTMPAYAEGDDGEERGVLGFSGLPATVTARQLLPYLPFGEQLSHADGMRKLICGLDKQFYPSGSQALLREYARSAQTYVYPIAGKLVRFDEETVARLMFPEDALDAADERVFYIRHPERRKDLWKLVALYFQMRFPRFERNVAAISTFFYISLNLWADVVEASSIALLNDFEAMSDGRGISEIGVIQSVRGIEAGILAKCLNVILANG
ncbi:MAG TPA: hypothetical protein VN420_00160 [Candidatus Fimivivens sp.]|nr:hypothetical protein [Candidatus Fimivivens sp.]